MGTYDNSKSISALQQMAYLNAVNKGWYSKGRSFGEAIALIHSELSEALEDYRNGRGFNEVWYEINGNEIAHFTGKPDQDWKPCGIPSELADVVIRVLDLCGSLDIDLEAAIVEKMAYNATRPVRHGGKVL